jgi:hypothetical protein
MAYDTAAGTAVPNATDQRALAFCHYLGLTGVRPGDRNMLGLKPR